MDVEAIKNKMATPGQYREKNKKGDFEAGLYRHPETGAEIVTLYDPLFGNAQSEGIARVGFVRVGDTPTGYIKTIVDDSIEKREKQNQLDDKSRLDQLELAESKRRIAELEAELEAKAAAKSSEQATPEQTEKPKTDKSTK